MDNNIDSYKRDKHKKSKHKKKKDKKSHRDDVYSSERQRYDGDERAREYGARDNYDKRFSEDKEKTLHSQQRMDEDSSRNDHHRDSVKLHATDNKGSHSKRKESSSIHSSTLISNDFEFEWESFKFHLDRIFFYEDSFIRRGGQEHFDFWNFVKKYILDNLISRVMNNRL